MKKIARSYNSTLRPVSDKQGDKIAIRRYWKPIILALQNFRCAKCKGDKDWRGWELSHKVPLSQGGKDEQSNYEALCARCHAVKRHNLREAQDD